MSDEATVRASLLIRSGSLYHQSKPDSFTADVTGVKGPTPGAVDVDEDGTNIDLSQLTQPGLATIQNLDDALTIILGVYDTDNDLFIPVWELLPGEIYPLRFSRYFGQMFAAGTGTADAGNVVLHAKCPEGTAVLVVNAFEA